MRRWLLVIAVVLAVAITGGYGFLRSVGMFAERPVYTTERGAIDGFDPVAYFEQGAAVPGSTEHALDWQGSRWLFASAANRDAFSRDPERFAPAYGGYCAYGMASGYTANTDPHAWTIVDGRLYLNFDADVQAEWQEDRSTYIGRADHNWPQSQPARNAAGTADGR